jgi:hypothetical protein
MQHRPSPRLALAAALVAISFSVHAGPQDIAAAAKMLDQAGKVTSKLAKLNVTLTAPMPVAGNTGMFMSPYRCDGSQAEWTAKAMSAAAGSAIGGMAGDKAAGALAGKVPFVGGFLGKKVKDKAAKEGGAMAAGGWEFIKGSSDMSFNSIEEMSVWLHVRHSSDEGFKNALAAAMGLYPELKDGYVPALEAAAKMAESNPTPAPAADAAAPVADAAAPASTCL